MESYDNLKNQKDFAVEWGNYRNMCRMSNIANVRREKFKEHFDSGLSAKEIFINLHEINAIRKIENLAFRLGYNIKLEKIN